ncbi:MAG TPA: tetratricopeptide repeat protein [Chitinophagaceae bacterium]|nr:tetratricopeptide repeat protein [Chitinophagaceae bacterium]
MKKTLITLFASGLLSAAVVQGQTLQEGMSHLNAGRVKNAISTFEKLLAVNPNNIEAIYWLGQSKLETDEIMSARIADARSVYEKALQATNGAPLIKVGVGHIDLLSGKTDDARQQFESALTMTRTKKGDDPTIETAIGRAITDAKNADYQYAIRLLEDAASKDPKNPETLLQLGNAYRKARPGEGGGAAFQAYKKAIELNPNYVAPYLRLAKLFETQKNWELVLQYLNEGIAKDPRFTAAYYELFYYYFFRAKFDEAESFLTKFIESKQPDADIQDQFLYAQLCWARKDFTCAISKAEIVYVAMGDVTKPKVFRLLADAYFQKKDYANAKKYSDLFFQKKNPDDYISGDHKIRADILSQTGGTTDEIFINYLQGSVLDTLLSSKIDFLKQGADFLKARGDSLSRVREGDLRLEIVKLKGNNAGQRDFFDAGFAYYQGKNYAKADSIFDVFTEKYPGEVYGPMMQYNIHRALDSTMEKGLAVPWAEKYLVILEQDTAKNKKNIIGVASYLASYYANILKDKTRALDYLKKMLALDPTNEVIKNNISALEKTPATKPPAPTKGTQPPAPAKTGNPKPSAKSKTTTKVVPIKT